VFFPILEMGKCGAGQRITRDLRRAIGPRPRGSDLWIIERHYLGLQILEFSGNDRQAILNDYRRKR
jgi:hypothetical protein